MFLGTLARISSNKPTLSVLFFIMYHNNARFFCINTSKIWEITHLFVPLRDDSKESPSWVSNPRRETKTIPFFLNPLAVCILMDGQSTRDVQ